jgi:hypothetical protein
MYQLADRCAIDTMPDRRQTIQKSSFKKAPSKKLPPAPSVTAAAGLALTTVRPGQAADYFGKVHHVYKHEATQR